MASNTLIQRESSLSSSLSEAFLILLRSHLPLIRCRASIRQPARLLPHSLVDILRSRLHLSHPPSSYHPRPLALRFVEALGRRAYDREQRDADRATRSAPLRPRRFLLSKHRERELTLSQAICLVNFANVVLVLQQTHSEYKCFPSPSSRLEHPLTPRRNRLINFFPATCLTQMFLGRLFFSLRAYSTRPRPHSFALPTRALHEPIDHTSPHDPSLPFQPEKASLVGPASLTTWDQKESSRPSPETSLDSISTLVHRSPFNEDSPPSPPPPSNHSPHVGSHHSPHGRSSSVDSSRRRERFFSVRLGTRKAREGMGGREKGGGGSE